MWHQELSDFNMNSFSKHWENSTFNLPHRTPTPTLTLGINQGYPPKNMTFWAISLSAKDIGEAHAMLQRIIVKY